MSKMRLEIGRRGSGKGWDETVRGHLLGGGLATLDSTLSSNVVAVSHARLGQRCHDYIENTGMF
jgi:hypothetical protein